MTKTVARRIGRVDSNVVRAESFRTFADRQLEASYRLARAILHDDTEAQDATHDAFVTAWQKWATLRDPAAFERWFQRILVNTCRNRLRRTTRWRITDISAELLVPTADAESRSDDREMIRGAMLELGTDDRILLALRYDRDLTVEGIADILSVPAGTVKSRLHHALRRLQEALELEKQVIAP